jgi:hypothetical protein
LVANLTRRFVNGLQMNLSYTWSKTMDDATAEVFSTVLTPRRQQNSQCISCDYSRSALDRTHRLSLEAIYDVQAYKHSDNFFMRNLIGNWLIAPIYTYESPEYATVLSGVNSNLNGDTATQIDRPLINPHGVRGTAVGTIEIVNPALQSSCSATQKTASALDFISRTAAANGPYVVCAFDTIGYSAGTLSSAGVFTPVTNAYYVQAGQGTLPNASRNTLPIRPIDNLDVGVYKSITFHERYSVQVGFQSFNVLNHPQYQPGNVDNVNNPAFTSSVNFQTVTNAFFNRPDKVFTNQARSVQLTGKVIF